VGLVATPAFSRYILRLMSCRLPGFDRSNRREFLQAVSPLLLTPLRGQFAQPGSSDKLGLGFIGMGNRGFQLLRMVADDPGVDIVSCGDIWTPHFDRLRELKMKRSFYTPMWIKVLMAEHLDGVIVALPDHLSAMVVEEALHRGKRVYVEPPGTHRWEEWGKIKAKSGERPTSLLYWGAQQLSSTSARTAAQWLADGKIGTLLSVEGEAGGYWGGFSPIPPGATLQERNWNWFLNGGSEREFDAHRFFTWGGYSDYSGGIAMRHFQHLLAAIQVVRPLATPVKVSSLGGSERQDSRWDLPDRVLTRVEFADGPPIYLSAVEQEGPPWFRVNLQGSEGRIEFSGTSVRQFHAGRYLEPALAWPNRYRTAYAKEIGLETVDIPADVEANQSPVEEIKAEADGTREHLAGFFKAVRSGQTGIAHEAMEHSELIGHLARRALSAGSAAVPEDLREKTEEPAAE